MSTLRWGRGDEPHARIPEWVLFADVSDKAIRLYCLLARYADAKGKAFPSKPRLMREMGGVARSTLDKAMGDLVRIGALDVVSKQRDDGGSTTNDYVIHWREEVNSRTPPSGRSEGPPSVSSEGQEERMPEGTTSSRADALEASGAQDVPVEPPPLTRVEGRNLAFDALAEACGIQPRSPRMPQVAAALNGRKGTTNETLEEGITHLFFHQCCEWIKQQPEDERPGLYASLMDPVRYETALAKAIGQKAREYQVVLPGATLTPTALRNWWLDLKGRSDGGMTSDDIRRFQG